MKKILFSVFVGITLLGCNDLNLVPENALTYTNAFVNEQNIDATTTSIQFFVNTSLTMDDPYIYIGFIADETMSSDELRSWSPKAVISGMGIWGWKRLYDLIYLGNQVIDNIHRAEDLPEDRQNFHLGQAWFAKGVAYYTLACRFGDCIITKDSKTTTAYGLSPAIDVINEAIDCAKKAYDMLPEREKLYDVNGALIKDRQYASKATAAALLAHLYAWKGSVIEIYGYSGDSKESYQESVKYATEIIDQKLGTYTLFDSHETACQIMSDYEKDNYEAVFELTYDHNRSQFTDSPSPGTYYVSWPVDKSRTLGDLTMTTEFRVYKKTIEELYPDPEDKRRQAYFYEFDTDHIVDDKTYALIYKWREATYIADPYSDIGYYFRTLKGSHPYWRLTEIYLLRAECNAKLGNNAAATSDLNLIRNRAGIKPFPNAGETDLKYAIFHERERELFGEGHRFYDIIRNNYIKEELAGKFKQLTPQEIKDGALYLPVPESAFKTKEGIVVNGLIRQNRYWSRYY